MGELEDYWRGQDYDYVRGRHSPPPLVDERPHHEDSQILSADELTPWRIVEAVNGFSGSVRRLAILAVGKSLEFVDGTVVDDPSYLVALERMGDDEIEPVSLSLRDYAVSPYENGRWNLPNYLRSVGEIE